MREQVLKYIRRHRLMRAGDRVGVAVSGGADSMALLRVLLELRNELGVVLSVVHFNHKIRGAEAEADEEFVRELAASLGAQPGAAVPQELEIPFFRGEGDAPRYARERKLSLETAARELRYAYFRELIISAQVERIATAHTLTDQAETVLLRLIRGAGTRGLAGVHRTVAVKNDGATCGAIVRPLLEITREQVEEYLRAVGQSWREDASNRDVSFARNRIRHELLPLLRRDYNPGIDQVLAETAEIARAEEEYWEEALREIPPCRARSTSFRGRDEGGPPNADLRGRDEGGPPALQLELMLQQPVAVRRRMVRAAAARLGCSLDFHHVEQVLALIHAAGERRGAQNVQVPGLEVTLSGRELRFAAQRLNKEEVSSAEGQAANSEAAGYDYPLALPGEVFIREIGRAFRASYLERRPENAGYNGYQLEPATLGSELRIRNWRAGDRYWPAHTKSPRKVKELLQERHILQPEKSRWPVVEAGNEIVWVPGFAPAAKFLARTGTGPVVVIEEVPVGVKGPSA